MSYLCSDEDSDTEASEEKDVSSSSENVSPDDSSLDSTEVSSSSQKTLEEEEGSGESEEASGRSPSTSEDETNVEDLAAKLLVMWSDLKEAYKIPKKERIEMMKEHERQVDNEYAKYLDKKKEEDRFVAWLLLLELLCFICNFFNLLARFLLLRFFLYIIFGQALPIFFESIKGSSLGRCDAVDRPWFSF